MKGGRWGSLRRRPTSPSPAPSRRGPSLSLLNRGEGLFAVDLRLRDTAFLHLFRFPGRPRASAGIRRGVWAPIGISAQALSENLTRSRIL